jgi:hypothetical protein
MSNSFDPARQRLSRFLKKFGIYAVFQKAYDRFVYPAIAKNQLGDNLARILSITDRSSVASVKELLSSFSPFELEGGLTRVGPMGDGGYLVPAQAFDIDALLSPGVAGSVDFELEYANNSINCFLIDASVDGPPKGHQRFNFQKKFLGPRTEGVFISLEDWLVQSEVSGSNLALQMDIEGAEFEVITSTPDDLWKRFKYIAIEFHDMHLIWEKNRFDLVASAMAKLNKTHFICHLHANNYGLPVIFEEVQLSTSLEITFARRSSYRILGPAPLPHRLDSPNNPNLRDFPATEMFSEFH